MDTVSDIEERLREFIITELGWNGNPADLSADYPLIEGRVFDSLGVLKAAGFIESAYRIDVDELELVFDNFSCLSAMARYVQGKQT